VEGIEDLRAGDVDTGQAILRDCINATVGLGELVEEMRRSTKVILARTAAALLRSDRQAAAGP
jgi:hypothetical protein